MGIKQLFQVIKEEAPDAIKEGEIKNQFGRKVAIVRPGCFSVVFLLLPAANQSFLNRVGCVGVSN